MLHATVSGLSKLSTNEALKLKVNVPPYFSHRKKHAAHFYSPLLRFATVYFEKVPAKRNWAFPLFLKKKKKKSLQLTLLLKTVPSGFSHGILKISLYVWESEDTSPGGFVMFLLTMVKSILFRMKKSAVCPTFCLS